MVLLCAISAAHVTLNYVALNVTSALNALTLQSITPVLIVVFCFLLFGDRMTALQLFGVSTSLTGVLVVVTRGSLDTLLNLAINWGDLVVIFTMTILAIYTAMLRKRPATHWLSFTALLYIASALLNLPFAACEASSGRVLTLDLPSLAALAYVAIFPSLLAYIFYNRGVELIGGGRAGAFTHLTPLFGAVLAMVFLGEKLMAFHVVGFVLIVSGIALTVAKRT
jgi:drug/metabolite transporter (DMT)-like permease